MNIGGHDTDADADAHVFTLSFSAIVPGNHETMSDTLHNSELNLEAIHSRNAMGVPLVSLLLPTHRLAHHCVHPQDGLLLAERKPARNRSG